jgi:putative transposase
LLQSVLLAVPHYIRAFVPGASYFFTVVLLDRRRALLTRNIDLLRDAFRQTRRDRPFRIDAVVILPDHVHCIWTLPEADTDYPTRWRLIKSRFSRAIEPTERLSQRRIKKRERGIWQRRYWEHVIRDQADMSRHVDYIHYNPVKHGWVRRPGDWPHSTFLNYVEAGILPRDWVACDEIRGWTLE